MISDLWTLKYWPAGGGAAVEQTLAQWGIESLVPEARDLQLGSFKFTVQTALATTPSIAGSGFANKSRIALYRSGVRFWEGRIIKPGVKIGAFSEAIEYTAGDSFYYFTQLSCHQTWRDGLGADYEYARMMLFFTRPCGVEIASIVDSVIADLAAGGDYAVGTDPLIAKGTIDDGMTPQPQKYGNVPFFDALRTVSRFDTSRVTWWDYSGAGAPVFHSRLAASLGTVNVPFPLVRFTATPWLEEKVPVVFLDVKVQSPFSGDAALPLLTTCLHYQYPDPYTGSLLGSIRLAVDDTEIYTGGAFAALCQAIWEQGQYGGWAGEVEIVEDECTGQLAVGKLLNITGGDPAWATMNAPIRSVTYDIARGRTVASFGPPRRLSLADLMELMHPFFSKILATKQENREKTDGQSDEYNMGDKGGKNDPDFPPKGWTTATGYFWNKATGKMEKYTFVVQGPGAVISDDLAGAKAFQDSGGTLVLGTHYGIKFVAD